MIKIERLQKRIEEVRKNGRLPAYQQAELTEIREALGKIIPARCYIDTENKSVFWIEDNELIVAPVESDNTFSLNYASKTMLSDKFSLLAHAIICSILNR